MAEGKTERIVVVGAGIVGVSAALWLQRAGYQVVVVDREGPASGTSYGNAGVLAAASVVPVPVPGLLQKIPGMLLSQNSPLFLRWSYLPKLMPFLRKFLGHANLRDVNRIADSLSDLLKDSVEQHLALAAGTPAESFIRQGDYVFGYANRAAYEADALGWRTRRDRGHEFEEMNAAQLAQYDPLMADRVGFAVRCPNHGYIVDPGEYVKALAGTVITNGGEVIVAEVEDIAIGSGMARGVETSVGIIEADEVVLATGVWSGPLAKKLGVDVPLESERGYHIEFVNPSVMPRSPVMVASGKFVITPMVGRLRCAGLVEFGGLHAPRSKAPLELLKRKTLELLPELSYDRIDEWMGHRPSTADSLPLIGAFDSAPNVWSAFGHQHIGLTAGPKTGRWVAQLIGGQTPNVDLAPFSPDRFP